MAYWRTRYGICPGADSVSFRLTNLIWYMRQWNSNKSRERALRRPHSLRVLPSEDPRVTLPTYRAAHSIASRAISNQLPGDKWVPAHHAVSTSYILKSHAF